MKYIKELMNAKCVIVLYTISFGGGATKSIFSYYKHNLRNQEKVVLVVRDSRFGAFKLLLAFVFGKRVIVNGLAAFTFWDMLLFCYFKKGAMFYLHEAEHAVNYFKRLFPLKFKIAARILRTRPLICVSRWQAAYFKEEFRNPNIRVIYETIALDKQVKFNKDLVNIVMVGYFSPRKGVSLFSQIADLAQEKNMPWKFHWVGAGPRGDLYFSSHVNWIGELANPLEVVKQADVFLLTSIDDPFPLACLEALSVYKKCIVYKNTGTAEVINGLSGCGVYQEYTAQAVVETIEKVVKEDIQVDAIENINQNISSIESFTQRLDNILLKKG